MFVDIKEQRTRIRNGRPSFSLVQLQKLATQALKVIIEVGLFFQKINLMKEYTRTIRKGKTQDKRSREQKPKGLQSIIEV